MVEHIELDGKYLLMLYDCCVTPELANGIFLGHHELELSCVKSGRGRYLIENKSYDLQEGDVFVFNANHTQKKCIKCTKCYKKWTIL